MIKIKGAPGADPSGLADYMADLGFAVDLRVLPAAEGGPVVVAVDLGDPPWWRRCWGAYLIRRWAWAAGWLVLGGK